MHFCQNFAYRRLGTRCSTKGAAHCSRRAFKTAALWKSHWYILSVLATKFLSIVILSIFCWWKVKYQALYKRSCSLLLSKSALKQLLWESLSNKFCWYLEQVNLYHAFWPKFYYWKVKCKALYDGKCSWLLS